jgi:ATP-binding protein involved in chromosome partitioning
MPAPPHSAPGPTNPKPRLPGVRHIIAVGSGKGGVGKSTVAVNLAIALHQSGLRAGLLDADIYGPSIPIMMGLRGKRPELRDESTMLPIEQYGIKTISMGFMLGETDAVVWRGPMLGKALQQFIEDVAWDDLDVLVIDLPPGTGDVQLSLTQLVPVTGAVVVTTPQDVSMADVRRAVRMFEMTRIPILGVVENMAYFHCADNGKDYYVFGKGRTEEACRQMGVPLLARMPLDEAVGPAADRGEPIVIADPDGDQSRRYKDLAKAVISAATDLGRAAESAQAGLGTFFKGPAKG